MHGALQRSAREGNRHAEGREKALAGLALGV